MIGGMISSTVLTLIVIPAIFGIVKGYGMPNDVPRGRRSRWLPMPRRWHQLGGAFRWWQQSPVTGEAKTGAS
jgi:hypothetical protein